ncbi:MAG: hypothetical protein JST47_09115 [Bacteroidetes bacterium]|nr:hypothetical protein [Bacteroidota bacterium]MBS1973631.1 hypothetical protein [Bacteroidota bacterium]
MNRPLNSIGILSAMAMVFSLTVSAQVYVAVKPVAPKAVRPSKPSPAYVWIEEDWNAKGGHYESAGSRWVLPPHPGWVWVPGRWVHSHKGWAWMPGHWRRARKY